MRSTHAYSIIAAILILWGNALTYTMSPRRPAGEITVSGTLTSTCIPTAGGTVFLQLSIDAKGFALPDRSYRPMNIAVVLDRSGSMEEERKLDFAKQSVLALIDRLSSADYLSIIIYDNEVGTLLPTQRVTDKERIKRLVRDIYPSGATNLGGGMLEGFRQLEPMLDREMVNRVMLLSDGLANRGITDPGELNRYVRSYRLRGISLTTIGVGLDYNENLMMSLAETGGGNYYFVESPAQLASIFNNEIRSASYVVAQNASIELKLGAGVRINDVIGYEWRREGNRVLIELGDVYADEHRELTAEVVIAEGRGRRNVVSGMVLSKGMKQKHSGFSIDIRHSDDVAEIEKSRDWDVQGKADIALSTLKVERAMKALDEGRREEAAEIIGTTMRELSAAPSGSKSEIAAPAIQEQIESLRSYEKEMKDERSDAKRVKKSIQYKNYQTQKKKE